MSVFLTLTSREPQCPEHEDVLDKEDCWVEVVTDLRCDGCCGKETGHGQWLRGGWWQSWGPRSCGVVGPGPYFLRHGQEGLGIK